jgi:hypothetical protein
MTPRDNLWHRRRECHKLLLVSAMSFTDAKTTHRNASMPPRVRHVHYTAIQRRADSTFVIPQVTEWDEYTQRELAASGLHVTVLRNSQYLDSLDDLIGELAPDGVIRLPAGYTPTAQATCRDIAEATAAVLATCGHEGRSYTLAGSRAVTLDDMARIISEVVGEPVTYQDTPVETTSSPGYGPECQNPGRGSPPPGSRPSLPANLAPATSNASSAGPRRHCTPSSRSDAPHDPTALSQHRLIEANHHTSGRVRTHVRHVASRDGGSSVMVGGAGTVDPCSSTTPRTP